MYTNDRAGKAVRIPAPIATIRGAPASRPIAHASGAARAPNSANGIAEAIAVGPSSQMNGTWTIDASGIQCALDGIGRTGWSGDRAADLGEDPDEVDVESVPRRELPRDVDVVEGIGVGGVGKEGRDGEPGHEREQVQGHGDPHGRCSLAPDPGHSRGYEFGYPDGPAVASRAGPDAAYGARVLTAESMPCRRADVACCAMSSSSSRCSGWPSACRRWCSTSRRIPSRTPACTTTPGPA